jgi:RNA recognition motif-containing protein
MLNGISTGHGCVSFRSKEDQERAMQLLDGFELYGKKIEVDIERHDFAMGLMDAGVPRMQPFRYGNTVRQPSNRVWIGNVRDCCLSCMQI